MHRLFLIRDPNIELTSISSNIRWTADVNSLSRKMYFTVGLENQPIIVSNPTVKGDRILMTDNSGQTVFTGIIIDVIKTGEYATEYECADIGWYLSENERVYQFNKVNANVALRRVLENEGIEIGEFQSMDVIIDRIFVGTSPASIVQYIINRYNEVNSQELRWRIGFDGKFHLFIRGSKVVAPTYQPSSNIEPMPISSFIENSVEVRDTLYDYFNSVRVVYQDDNRVINAATASSETTFGDIEKVFNIPREDVAKANRIAQVRLNQGLRDEKECRMETMGFNFILPGDSINWNVPTIGLVGLYEIESYNQVSNNGIHSMTLEMREVK